MTASRTILALGTGRLNWRRGERVSDRYGTVALLDPDDETSPEFAAALSPLPTFERSRGRLLAEVLESRPSGHIGDLFAGHSAPASGAEVGAVRCLGEGELFFESDEYGPMVGLKPDRGPEPPRPRACPVCGPATGGGYGRMGGQDAGDGLTPESRAISRTFYPHQIGGPRADALAWHDKIGQAEVDNLIAHGRLSIWRDGKWVSEPRTAAEINAEQGQKGGLGHDGINHSILMAFRCERLGIPMACPACEGHGWEDMEAVERWEAWDPKRNWLDPKVLYELHNQTVRLWFEEAPDARD